MYNTRLDKLYVSTNPPPFLFGRYPGKITESQHRATIRTPAAAAALLCTCPQLLPAAVQAFYLRDPLDLRACRAMRFFPPETCVKTSVVFTKTLYAQLVQQRYRPDVRTGWNIPAAGSEEFRAADVGMKLVSATVVASSGQERRLEFGEWPLPTVAALGFGIVMGYLLYVICLFCFTAAGINC